MDNYVFEGTVKLVDKVQEFASGFKKREIVVSSLDDKFQQDIKFEFLKDSIEKLEGIKTGDRVKVAFDLRGNEYKGKYYNNLVGISIGKVKPDGKVESQAPSKAKRDDDTEGEDDLPF